jgi:RNA polymerase sigma-70 factor (ECF subfamily)
MNGTVANSGEFDERLIIEACRQGNKEMFRPLVERYRQQTFFLALQIVGNREDAMDISQESFIRAYRNLGKFDTGRPFGAWLLRIVRNLCIDLLRRRKVRKAVSLDNPGRGRDGETGRPLHETVSDKRTLAADVLVERSELKEKIWRALGRLDEKHRTILVLRDFQDLSYLEMADALGVPKGTVMSRLHQARRRLREELTSDDEEQ